MPVGRTVICILLAGLAAACGKKGAPLAPLYLVPASVSDVSARRMDDAVELRFVLPSKNQNGPGIDLDRVQIYAITAAPGTVIPPNRDLLSKRYLAGEVTVKPPPVEGAPPSTDDKRPGPGDPVTFVERLSPQILEPAPLPKAPPTPAAPPAPAPAVPATAETPSAAPASVGAALPALPEQPRPADEQPATPLATGPPPAALAAMTPAAAQPVRIYVIRGVARNGRTGAPSARLQVPLGTVPDPPGGVIARHTEKAVIVEWLPSVATIGGPAPAYNIFGAAAPEQPLNAKPLASPSYEQVSPPLGDEICFRVRSVEATGAVSVESALSAPACVTPADVFPPAAPKGLAPVATDGAVNLIWDANTEPDVAGYLVLRAEAPDETLQALTPAPIRDTFYRDTSVKPGMRYVYAIVAVDSATRPNRSEPSRREEVVAR